jgi:hypothetical protein
MVSVVEELWVLILLVNFLSNIEYLLFSYGSCFLKIEAVQVDLIVCLEPFIDLVEHLPSDVPPDFFFPLLEFFGVDVPHVFIEVHVCIVTLLVKIDMYPLISLLC